jgi:alkanesulfonate monooxygenase SsuD/methylene tetrahydromethanopterin reductase-like flavin-dependent oxidoreductase (luciferase family)
MWSDNDGPYEGAHYRLAETLNVPQSLQRPHPPIMIGGGGEQKLLRLVAKYADANNLFPASPEEVQHKLDVLARHCEAVGRDRSEIRNTTISRISAETDVDAFVADMAPYAALGFEHVQLGLLGDEPAQLVERAVTKIVPRLADL